MAIPGQRILANQLVRSTATYALADAANKAVPYLLLPVIASQLSTADYGLLTNFSVLTQVLNALCALNTHSALGVSYFRLGKDGLPGYLSNLLYLVGILATLCLLVSSLFSATIQHYFGLSVLWQLLALLTAAATAVYTLYATLLRMQNRALLFGIVQVAQSLVAAVLTLAFVVQLKWNWQGRALSIAAAAAITMLFCIASLRRDRYVFLAANGPQIKHAFSFGLPLLPHTMSFWLKTGLVKIIITNFIGLSANGVYSIALTLGGIVGVFTDAFFSAYTPSMFKRLSMIDSLPESDRAVIRRALVENTYRFAATLLVVCIGGWLAMRWAVPLLFSGGYLAAVRLLPVVFVALYFDGLYSIVSAYVFYRGRTKTLGTITFLSSLLQVTLTVVFVRQLGLVGALYVAGFVSFLTFVAVLIQADSLYHLPWRLKASA
jgi:O-antigen/teichoic acid export membrane protein